MGECINTEGVKQAVGNDRNITRGNDLIKDINRFAL